MLRTFVVDVLTVFDWFVLIYFLVLNSTYLVLALVASRQFIHEGRRVELNAHDDILSSPLTPPVSIIMPAHNEELGIVDSVHANLALRYPEFEVVVVDDGSTDSTFELLRREFGLLEIPKVIPMSVPVKGEILSVHVATTGDAVTVVRKVSVKSKSDANNSGINVARYPICCMVDADGVLDEEALLHAVKPFIDDPKRVVASGGSIRAINGCVIERGRLIEARMPDHWIPRIQTIEYLRAFLVGRTGWSQLQGLLIISGAFGVFRRDIMIEIGGYDVDTIGEDADLVARIHKHLINEGRDYRIVFAPAAVCWTEVPPTAKDLGKQRRRWSRGLYELCFAHKDVVGNPKYGRMGTVVFPYYVAFELLGPVIELTGFVAVAAGFAFGVVNLPFALLFLAVALGFGALLGFLSLVIEELTYRRYRRWGDLWRGAAASVLENVGFRQLHAFWRLQGLWQGIRGGGPNWESSAREGFGSGITDPPIATKAA